MKGYFPLMGWNSSKYELELRVLNSLLEEVGLGTFNVCVY